MPLLFRVCARRASLQDFVLHQFTGGRFPLLLYLLGAKDRIATALCNPGHQGGFDWNGHASSLG